MATSITESFLRRFPRIRYRFLKARLENPSLDGKERRKAFETLRSIGAPSIRHQDPVQYQSLLQQVSSISFAPFPDHTTVSISQQDRICGTLFGAAVGDAVGLATEFMSKAEIQQNYPSTNIFRPCCHHLHPDAHRAAFPTGDWTDDTDQMILVLQTLLGNKGRYNGALFASKLEYWVYHGFAELGDSAAAGLGRTTQQIVTHADFALYPQAAAHMVWDESGQCMAPNGGLMRTAVTGIPYFDDADRVRRCNFARPPMPILVVWLRQY